MRNYIKKILYLLGDYRRKFPWLLLLFLSSSLLDLAGIGLIGPYVALIVSPKLFIQSDFYLFIASLGIPPYVLDNLVVTLGLGLIVIFLLKTVSALYINRRILRTCYQHGVELRSFLMDVYQKLPYTKYLQRNSSEYVYNIQTVTSHFTQLQQSILRLISEVIVSLAIFSLLAWSDHFALGLLVLLLGALAFLHDLFFRKKVQEYGRLGNTHSALMVQNIHEGIEGLKEIRILGKEKYFHRMLEKNAKVFAEASINANIVSTMPRYFLELILIVFIVLLVFKSIFFDQNFNDLLPTISMFGIAAMRLAPSTSQIISSISRLRHNAHSIDLLYDDLKSLKGLHSSEKGHISMSRVEKDQPCKPFHSIELQQVQFTYPKTNKLVLDNLSITIRAGDSIGLIGSSGSGKTTMVDLLLGLLEPNKGKILYNNKPLIKNLADWQSTVGYLPQKVFLIDDTLRKNIALGVDEEEISDNKILEALHQARLTELVMQLPKGINTTLGEHGIRLSGGQRQRVALARAFYHQRSVLIMDESTSALDNETEHEIVEEIKRLKGRKTIIVIAHRLTTLQHCDYIYRMDNGKLVQDGDYESVIKKSNK